MLSVNLALTSMCRASHSAVPSGGSSFKGTDALAGDGLRAQVTAVRGSCPSARRVGATACASLAALVRLDPPPPLS